MRRIDAAERFVVGYERGGRLLGPLAVDMNRRLPSYRQVIEQRAAMGDAFHRRNTIDSRLALTPDA